MPDDGADGHADQAGDGGEHSGCDEDAPRLVTEREREVLTLVGRGMSNSEIAAHLYISIATVKAHVARLLSKLHARDRVQLVIVAYEAGLVSAT